MKTIEQFDDYLSKEIREFDQAAEFGQKKGLTRYGTYAAGCRDVATIIRAVLRTSFLPDRVESGEVIMAVVATKRKNN